MIPRNYLVVNRSNITTPHPLSCISVPSIQILPSSKSFLKSWEKVSPEKIKFERLADLSNVIWKVTALDQLATPTSIIYRKFGEHEEIIDRDRENYIFTELAKKGLGPSYYGGDQKARLEEFYESRSMKPSDVNNKIIRRAVAKSLANLHKANLEGLDKTPMFLKVLEQRSLMKLVEEKAHKDIYSSVEKKWLYEILSLVSEDEVSFLKEILPKGKNSVVFSHNDLHSQNILLLDKTQKIILIDYEYSSYNYRGYDIANFFNEATIDYNVTEYPYYSLDDKKYPSEYDLIDFIKYYLFFFKFDEKIFDEILVQNDDDYFKQIIKENASLDEFNAEIEEIFEEVRVCTMLSHYYWVLWSVFMSKNPDIQFDYIHYAYRRFEVYQRLKQEYYSSEYPKIYQILIKE